MTVRKDQAVAPENGAENWQPDALDRRSDETFMARACDPIQDNARKVDVAAITPAPQGDGRRRLRLRGNIQRQNDGPARESSQIGGRAFAAAAFPARAVEKPHDAFGDTNIGANRGFADKVLDEFAPHAPCVEIEAFAARGLFVKCRIDVIGTALEGLHRQAPPLQRPHKPKRKRGFARA